MLAVTGCQSNLRFLYSQLDHRRRILRASAVINQMALFLTILHFPSFASLIRQTDSGRRMPVRPGRWRLPDQTINPDGAGHDIFAPGCASMPVVLALAGFLDRRSASTLAWLFLGALLARGRRTVTSWIRAVGLSQRYQRCYVAVAAAGKKAMDIAARLVCEVVSPLVADQKRLTLVIDDTPTQRYGPLVQGAGIHHNPTPGPAGSPHLYGHIWVVLGLLAHHPAWGVIALPLLARMYVRRKDLPGIYPQHRPEFQTKLEMAVELLRWAYSWLKYLGKPLWVVADGAYAKAPFLKPAMALGMTVVSRLRKDAALYTVPGPRVTGSAAGRESMGIAASTWPSEPVSVAAGRPGSSSSTASG